MSRVFYCRAGKKKLGTGSGRRVKEEKNLQTAYLVFWQVYPIGKQRVPAQDGDLEKTTNWGRMGLEREEWCHPLERGVRH